MKLLPQQPGLATQHVHLAGQGPAERGEHRARIAGGCHVTGDVRGISARLAHVVSIGPRRGDAPAIVSCRARAPARPRTDSPSAGRRTPRSGRRSACPSHSSSFPVVTGCTVLHQGQRTTCPSPKSTAVTMRGRRPPAAPPPPGIFPSAWSKSRWRWNTPVYTVSPLPSPPGSSTPTSAALCSRKRKSVRVSCSSCQRAASVR